VATRRNREGNDMNDRELYRQKKQAQLDEWKADMDRLRAKASGDSADAQLKLNREIDKLEGRIGEGRTKLAEIVDASEDTWESIKDGADSVWDSIKSTFSDVADKFKK
jgi:septal ring factor EnvC (AmiA/AmiB activator)